MPRTDHIGIKLQSGVKYGRDGTPYVVQRRHNGDWRGLLFDQEPVKGGDWLSDWVRKRSDWYENREDLQKWIKRNTRIRRGTAPRVVPSSEASPPAQQ